MFLRICIIPLLLAVATIFTSCSGSSGSPTYNPAVGPFDENGNYVEAWADNPPARNADRRVASNPKPDPAPVSRPAPVAAIKPVTVAPAPIPVAPIPVAPRPVAVTPAPRPVAVTQPITRTSQPVVTTQPTRTRRHTVTRGDTLYGLARKYGTTVTAIKKANGISGSTIITGRSYIIPR